jgi:hypothetical protein
MRTLVFFTLLLAPSLAMAQSKPALYPLLHAAEGRAGNPPTIAAERRGIVPRRAAMQIATPDELWRKIMAANAADLRYAKALADAIGSAGAKQRAACYEALIATIEQAQGAGLKDANGNALTQPDPHAFSSFEQLAEVAEALQPTGPLMAACAPAWTALKLSAFQFFTLAVSGAAGLAALGVAIP